MRAEAMVERRPIMDKGTPIGSIGSCFASHLKGYLIENGFNYVQTSDAPGSAIGSAAWGVVYNTFCIRQEMARASGAFTPDETEWPDGGGGLLDPYRKDIGWKNQAAAAREREAHARDARRALEAVRVFIITAGLAEIWFNRGDGSVFYQVPPPKVYDPERHGFRLSTVDENADNLEEALRYLWAINPGCEVVLTVSPVPLRATFRPMNVVVANTQSKAILLGAVHRVAERLERVHYFPSYELVTVLATNPFKDDNRHVRPGVIRGVMDVFTRSFVK